MKTTKRFGTTVRSNAHRAITNNDVMIEVAEQDYRITEAAARQGLIDQEAARVFWNAEYDRTRIRLGNRPCVRRAPR